MVRVTICKDCKFAERGAPGEFELPLSGHCLNEEAPVRDFVYGFRICGDINKGGCEFFEGCGGE